MGSKKSSLLSLILLLALSSAIHAFDITKMLGQHPDLSTFNKYLTETKLASEINSRNTITVLAVGNDGISSIANKSPEAIKAILSTHVILDYFDEKKLMEAQGSNELLTTLYQTTGNAVNQQGFIKVKLIGEGGIAFGSAVSGAPVDAELVRTVMTEPYNISILRVSKPITVPGIDKQTPPSGAQSPQAAKAPASSSQGAKAPASSSQGAKAPASSSQGAKAPVPSSQGAKAPVASPKRAPSPVSAEAPTPAESVAESPETTATEAPAAGPLSDDGAAADATEPSSSSTTKMGLVGTVMTLASLFIVF